MFFVDQFDSIVDGIDDGGGGQYIDLLLFVKIRTFDSGFGLQIRILTPSRVEMIGKTSILRLELQPIDRARSQLSKTPLIAFLRLLQAKIRRVG